MKGSLNLKKISAFVALSILSGLAGFAVVALINRIISESINNALPKDKTIYLALFGGLIGVFYLTRRLLAVGIIKLSQSVYWGTRLEIVKLIINAPYPKIRKLKNEVYSTLTQDVENISQASLLIIDFVTSIVLIFACLGYMAYLSFSMFLISLGVIVIGMVIYEVISRSGGDFFRKSRELEKSFIHSFNAILQGSKEIKMAPEKGEDIYAIETEVVANEAKINNQKAYVGFLNSQLIGQMLFYMLIAFILLYAGELLSTAIETTISYVFVLLYILGPIATVMMVIPIMTKARISIRKMNELRAEFEVIVKEEGENHEKYEGSFESIEYKNFHFAYGENQFGIGPINLKLIKGDINFVYGGNGSGKTTFMLTLLTIYGANSGNVLLNGEEFEKDGSSKFKSLFSVVFGDFYLFDKFYGNQNFNQEKAEYYIELFEMKEKVSICDNGFSTVDLSMGQRKRLALISVLLEEKPILVLDEWAADQDPYFRKKFYTEIIPSLKNEGRTILAITHDDRYYSCADRLFKMEFGKLTEEKLVTRDSEQDASSISDKITI